MRAPGGVELGRAVYGFSLFVVVLCALFAANPVAAQQMVGSPHDFQDGLDRNGNPVQEGFNGGGICASCHVPHFAGDVRLWPRAAAGPLVPDRLCINCHYLQDPTPPGDAPTQLNPLATIFSAEPAWALVQTRPPARPFSHGPAFANCTRCHRH